MATMDKRIEQEERRREDQLIAAITTPDGRLRPITEIRFELLGNQVRWSIVGEGGRLLHGLTDRLDQAAGFLEPTKDLLEMIVADRQAGST